MRSRSFLVRMRDRMGTSLQPIISQSACKLAYRFRPSIMRKPSERKITRTATQGEWALPMAFVDCPGRDSSWPDWAQRVQPFNQAGHIDMRTFSGRSRRTRAARYQPLHIPTPSKYPRCDRPIYKEDHPPRPLNPGSPMLDHEIVQTTRHSRVRLWPIPEASITSAD